MKKEMRICLVGLACTLAFSLPAWAAGAGTKSPAAAAVRAVSEGVGTAKTTANLNLRSSMEMGENVLQVLPRGTVVIILSREADGWFHVSTGEKTGYVSGAYLADNTNIRTTTSNVNRRFGPGTDTQSLEVIPQGAKVEVIRQLNNGWTFICYKGNTGYVFSQYLKGPEAPAKTIDLKNVKFENIRVNYDGRYHRLPQVKNLPKGVKVTYSTTKSQKNIGTYKVKATFKTERSQDKLKNAKERTAVLEIRVKKGASYRTGDFRVKVTKAELKGKGTVAITAPRNTRLKKLSVPKTVTIGGTKFAVTEISPKAFKGCRQLTEASLGNNLKTIGHNAFEECTKLKTVKIGNAVKTIEDRAFKNCKKLQSVKMGTAVRTIGQRAFYGDAKLKEIVIKSTVLKEVGYKAFMGIAKKAVINVPNNKVNKYLNIMEDAALGAEMVVK